MISCELQIDVGIVFISNLGFLCFETTRFRFFIIEHSCLLFEFILFPCQNIIILFQPTKRKQNLGPAQR